MSIHSDTQKTIGVLERHAEGIAETTQNTFKGGLLLAYYTGMLDAANLSLFHTRDDLIEHATTLMKELK